MNPPENQREVGKFRKKQGEVEAMRYLPGENCEALFAWIGVTHDEEDCHSGAELLLLDDRTGRCNVTNPGDYVVREPDGRFFPYKPAIFEETYEPA